MTTNANVPGLWPVALDGRAYLVDLLDNDGGFVTQSIPLLRNQADQGARPGEQSLNPEDLWRRSVESWHLGAGQSHADRADSSLYRFRASKHLDPFTKYKLSLLNKTVLDAHAATNTAQLVACRNKFAYSYDTTVKYSSGTFPPASTPTGLPAWNHSVSMTSDGTNPYLVGGDFGVWTFSVQTGVGLEVVTNPGVKTLLMARYVKDRLLVFEDTSSIYDASVFAAPLPAALFTHPRGRAFKWTDATSGQRYIYACGGVQASNDNAYGIVYKIGILEDGTGLAPPIIAGRLPDGEMAYAILGYLGLVLIGTSLGVRVCQEETDGSITVGPLIETGPCYCFEPQGTQVWFSWTGGSEFLQEGGLGRIDLSNWKFADGVAPPYAADLESAFSGAALAAITWDDHRVFADHYGIWNEDVDTPEDTGTLVSGLFSYGLTSPKTFHYLHVKGEFDPVLAVNAYVDDDNAANQSFGLARTNLDVSAMQPDGSATSESAIFDLTGWRAEQLEYKLDVYSTINRVTLMARPAIATRSEQIAVTLLLAESLDLDGQDEPADVFTEVQAIRAMMQKGSPVIFQAGAETYPVVVEDYSFIRTSEAEPGTGKWRGAIQVKMKRFDTVTPIFRGVRTGTVTGSATFNTAVPDGLLPGDILYAAVAWTNPAVAAPTVSGWVLVDSAADTNFRSATYKQVGTAVDLDLTFAGVVTGVAAILAYMQGDDIEAAFSEHDITPAEYVTVNDFVNDAVAAVAATVAYQPFGALKVPAVRSRGRVTNGTLTLDVGDALSVSSYESGGEIVDALSGIIPLPASGEVRVWVDKLTK